MHTTHEDTWPECSGGYVRLKEESLNRLADLITDARCAARDGRREGDWSLVRYAESCAAEAEQLLVDCFSEED